MTPESQRARRTNRSRRAVVILGLVWIAATLYNIDKAFHIDDVAYLESARWIAVHPLHPMQGLVNWTGDPLPIHFINQPALYPYLLAAWGSVFGDTEVPLHLMQSLFTLAAIVLFHRLARRFVHDQALALGLLWSICPALIVGQNLMTDVPLIALWLAFYAVLLGRGIRSDAWRYACAGLVAGAAILTNYASLVLLPALPLDMILRRRYRALPWIVLPLAIVAGWSAFNWWDYHGIHILERPIRRLAIRSLVDRSLAFVVTLGAVSPFSVVFLAGLWKSDLARTGRFGGRARLAAAAALCVIIGGLAARRLGMGAVTDTLMAGFLLNGGVLCVAMGRALWLRMSERDRSPDQWVLHYSFWSAAAFLIAFAPFMAMRHVLAVTPALLLILGRRYGQGVARRWWAAAMISTAALTIVLGAADWNYANLFRREAAEIRNQLPAAQRVWFLGHWGWQYYAKQAGMLQLAVSQPLAEPGDWLVRPQGIAEGLPDRGFEAAVRRRIVIPADWVSTLMIDPMTLYWSPYRVPPWRFSRESPVTFEILQVTANPHPASAPAHGR